MNKAAIVALLFGMASANTITGWTIPKDAATGGRYNILSYSWASVQAYYEADLGYSTNYVGHAPDTLMAGFQGETYGIDFYSDAMVNLDISLFNGYYTNSMRHIFEPLMVAPYEQTILWSRPEAQIGDYLIVAGSRSVRALNFFSMITENAKVGKKSLHNIISNKESALLGSSNFGMDSDFENKFFDPYWSKNIIFDLDPSLLQSLTDQGILGDHDWYSEVLTLFPGN